MRLIRGLLVCIFVHTWMILHAGVNHAFAVTADGSSPGFYEEGLVYYGNGDYVAAIIQLKNALRANPDFIPARILAGRIFLILGDGESAEKELRAAQKLGADSNLLVVPLARSYLIRGKFSQLLDEFFPYGRSPEVEAELLQIHGMAHLQLGAVRDAERAFWRASDLRPNDPGPMLGLARLEIARRNLQAAEELADKAADADPSNQDVWYLKGEIRRHMHDFESAISHFGEAVAIVQQHIPALVGRAASLMELGRNDQALEDIILVQSIVPNHPQASYMHAVLLTRTGDFAGAKAVLREISLFLESQDLEFVMSDPDSLILAGLVKYGQQNYEDAYLYLSRYVELVPYQPGALKLLGKLLIQRNDILEATNVFRKIVSHGSDDPKVYTLLGNAYMRDRQYNEATKMFEKAASLAPDIAKIRTQLALSRLVTGQSRSAIDDLRAAIELGDGDSQPGELLGIIQLRNGDAAEALDTAQKLMERQPENPFHPNLAGSAYVALNDAVAARSSFESALEIDPTYLPAALNLAELDIHTGDLDQAEDRYYQIIDENPEASRAMIGLANIYESRNHPQETIGWLEKAVAFDDTNLSAVIRLFNHYMSAGRIDTAREMILGFNEEQPENLAILEGVARSELAVGQYDKAARALRKIASLENRSPSRLTAVAALQMEAKDLEGARLSLKTAIKIDEKYVPGYAALVALESGLGNRKTSLDLVNQLRANLPATGAAAVIEGDMLMRNEQFAEAAKVYKAGLETGETSELVI